MQTEEKTSEEKPYQVLINTTGLARIKQYAEALAKGTDTPGIRMQAVLLYYHKGKAYKDLSYEQWVDCFLKSKMTKVCAESEVNNLSKNGNWTSAEFKILAEINMSVPVLAYDNGVWGLNPKMNKPPLETTLLGVPGPLLKKPKKSPDYAEVVKDRKINIEQYNQMIERRFLNLLAQANKAAKNSGKKAFITMPGVGCGCFAGDFKKTITQTFRNAFVALLKKHGHKFKHIEAIYFDAFEGLKPSVEIIHGITFLTLTSKSNPSALKQLSPLPEEHKDCQHFTVLAWDALSWPGNDYWGDSRHTDDGAKGAATDVMSRLSGLKGEYSETDKRYVRTDKQKWAAFRPTWKQRLSAIDVTQCVDKEGTLKPINEINLPAIDAPAESSIKDTQKKLPINKSTPALWTMYMHGREGSSNKIYTFEALVALTATVGIALGVYALITSKSLADIGNVLNISVFNTVSASSTTVACAAFGLALLCFLVIAGLYFRGNRSFLVRGTGKEKPDQQELNNLFPMLSKEMKSSLLSNPNAYASVSQGNSNKWTLKPGSLF